MAHSWSHIFDVIRTLVRRDFVGRYRNTALGMLWALVSPMLFLGVFYFVFGVLFKIGIEKYASFVLVGVLSWAWFQQAVAQAVSTITANPNLVSQPGFPTAALPVVAVTATLLNFLIAVPLVMVVFLIEGVQPSATYILLPAVIITQYVLALAVCYFVAAINVTARDVQYIVPVILQIGYYITPIFYSPANIPPEYIRILSINPMYTVINAYRDILIYNRAPPWADLMLVLVISLGLLVASFLYFRRASLRFLEEI